MPSRSRRLFRDKLLPDVASLIEAHRKLNPNGRGRRALGYITRSGILMLCAAWEVYIEDVLLEGLEHTVQKCGKVDNLPPRVKGKVCQVIKSDKHDFAILKLAGDGWKKEITLSCKRECESLNTPKFGPVSTLFGDWLGVDDKELLKGWRHSKDLLNDFVTLRGEIAHRGADSQYVQISTLREYKEKIDELVVDTDRFLSTHIKQVCGTRPWNNS